MKNKYHSRQKNRVGFASRALLTFALVFGLLGAALFPSNAAGENAPGDPSDTVSTGSDSLNLEEKCKLTVVGNKVVTSDELKGAGVVIDLYKVAEAEALGEWYTFKPYGAFSQLVITTDLNADDWLRLAQEAAGIVLNNADGVKALKEAVGIDQKVEELGAGLYLLVARGGEKQDYFAHNAQGEIVTKAVSNEYTYTFLPVLVAVPGRESVVSDTQTFDKWLYDVRAVLKVERQTNEQDEEYGSLKIVKTLNGFAPGGDPATFVFQVEAVLGGQKVYSNVVTLVFDREGRKELLVENIPVGSKVTVTEVYSGASYSLTSSQTQTATIAADQIPSVAFTNRYDERENGGHGITNHFTYENGGWKLKQSLDKSQG